MNLAEAFGTALGINADGSYNTPRTSNTATADAVQSMQPVDNQSGGAFGDFWRGAASALLDYAIVRDAARHGITPTGQASPVVQMEPLPAQSGVQSSGMSGSALLLVAGVGAVVVALIVAKAAK